MNKYTDTRVSPVTGSIVAGSTPAWSSAGSVRDNDTSYAQCTIAASGNSGQMTISPLGLTGGNFGTGVQFMAMPDSAEILGIMLEIEKFQNTDIVDSVVQMRKNGVAVGTNKANTNPWLTGWANRGVYGGPTDLWGTTLTVTELKSSLTDFVVQAHNNNSGASSIASIQYAVITIYWRTKASAVPKTYRWRVFNRANVYQGVLPVPSSNFTLSQEINTAGGMITVDVPVSIDTAQLQSGGSIQDETGADLQDESGNSLLTEGSTPVVSLGTGGGLIRNGNKLVVTEYSSWYPNGRVMFRGTIEKWQASVGGGEVIRITAYSDGSDMDNFQVFGYPYTYTLDQQALTVSQTSAISRTSSSVFDLYGQTFTVGAGVTNLGAISVWLVGTAHVTINVYTSNDATVLLGSVTQLVTGANGEVQLTLPNHIIVVPGTKYFFNVDVAIGESINVGYALSSVYAGGEWYRAYSGNSYIFTQNPAVELYFKTFSTLGTRNATFNSQDPSKDMVKGVIDDYRIRGGLINYAAGTIDASGLSLSYSLKSATILEAIKAFLGLCPNGFYWYVEMGTNTLYVKQASVTPDVYLVKGVHMNGFELTATIEPVVNDELLSGGDIGGGVNLFKEYTDNTSIGLYGLRLTRKSDNRVTISGTADAIGTSDIARLKDEGFQTVVKLSDTTIDTASLRPGMIVGYRAFGSFVDSLMMEIVRFDYQAEETILTLGILPKRMSLHTERITRELIALQTIDNPATPS